MTDSREVMAYIADEKQHALAEQCEKILAYQAGPELDALVATDVLGHRVTQEGRGLEWERDGTGWAMLKSYSTDAGVAWAMLGRFWAVRVECCDSTFPEVIVTISGRDGREWDATGSRSEMPVVACRAALLAKLETGS